MMTTEREGRSYGLFLEYLMDHGVANLKPELTRRMFDVWEFQQKKIDAHKSIFWRLTKSMEMEPLKEFDTELAADVILWKSECEPKPVVDASMKAKFFADYENDMKHPDYPK